MIPCKEELIVFERIAETSNGITVSEESQKAFYRASLMELIEFYNGQVFKDFGRIGNSTTIVRIPFERSDYYKGQYDGIELRVFYTKLNENLSVAIGRIRMRLDEEGNPIYDIYAKKAA